MLEPLEFRLMLVVDDLAANLHFYEVLLGLRRVMAWDGGAILSLGPGRSLELRQGKSPLPNPLPGGEGTKSPEVVAAGTKRLEAGREAKGVGTMVGIAVSDAAAAHDVLVAAGTPIARKLKDNPWGDRSFALTDPNGIRVWVYQITDPALASELGIEE